MNSDLISRQAAIELIERMKPYHQEADDIAEMIANMPSAQPERNSGKWIRRLVDSGFNADWHCSECGWKTCLEEHGYNFCPNCGADMRGEHED